VIIVSVEEPIYTVSIVKLARTFREVTNSHYASSWIWESAKRLSKTTVEWEYAYGDNRFTKGISSLFSAEISEDAKRAGVLRFSFPTMLIPILKDPRRFARLRTHVMMSLSGKYSVTLYELLESVVNLVNLF
jgi:Initiator Replication protein